MLKNPQILKGEKSFKDRLIKSQRKNSNMKNPEPKSNKIIMNKNIPISLFDTNATPNQSTNEFSVKKENLSKGKIDMNKTFHNSPFQQNVNNKIFLSQNMKNSYSDLHTSASFNSYKSSESFYSINNNNNNSQFIPNNFILMPNNNFNTCQTHKKISSSIDYTIDLNNNYFYRNNLSSKELTDIINNTIINPNCNQNLPPIDLNNNSLINEIKFSDINLNNIFQNNNKFNNESNHFQTQISVDISELNSLTNKELLKIDSMRHSKSNNINTISKNNNNSSNYSENHNRKKSKNYYNKFNTSKENNMNENTVILTLKMKVGKNDYRIFNLKKYDDLFVSLEKFVDINKIKQELVKPLVSKIFEALNKIFWLLNNKIGIYDLQYLNSLYKLWIKNNREIPKSRNKTNSDRSTTSSSESSSESSFKDIKSNSFQNSDGNNSSDEKERQHTSNSF